MEMLSDNLSVLEFTHSDTATAKGINNSLPNGLVETAKLLAVSIFEPVRALFGAPVHVDSGYRCQALNQTVRGVPTSQHCLAEALDLVPSNLSINAGIKLILQSSLSFDQLIQEGTWLHISSKVNEPEQNRMEILLTKDHQTYQHLTKEEALSSL